MVENLASELSLMGFSTTVILPFYKYDINGNKLNLDNFDLVEKTKHEVKSLFISIWFFIFFLIFLQFFLTFF
jgi:hypothetical protein